MSASVTRTRPIGRGTVAGVVAFVAGYLVTYLWQAAHVREWLDGVNAILQFFGGESLPAWKAVGWVFFNAHFVRTQIPTVGGTRTQNYIASGEFPALLYAVPIVLLVATGFLLVRSRHPTDLQDGAIDGATIAIGYAGAAIVGVFGFGATRGEVTVAPDPVTGVLLAGIVFPLVLGAIGGALASVVASTERGTRETTAD